MLNKLIFDSYFMVFANFDSFPMLYIEFYLPGLIIKYPSVPKITIIYHLLRIQKEQ